MKILYEKPASVFDNYLVKVGTATSFWPVKLFSILGSTRFLKIVTYFLIVNSFDEYSHEKKQPSTD